jgi:hypothetical protein
MADVAPGTGFANIAGGIGDILSGAAPVISGITGRGAGPSSVTYVTAPQPRNNNSSLIIVIAIVIIVAMFIFLSKK